MNELHRSEGTIRLAGASSWIKSSLSHANGNCLEAVGLPGGQVGVRDSKDIGGPVLQFSPEEWQAFLNRARNGEFDNFATQ